MSRADGPRRPRPHTKLHNVWLALRRRQGMNRLQAEVIGDHCLPSTVAALRAAGWPIIAEWQVVQTRFGQTRFKNYRLAVQP